MGMPEFRFPSEQELAGAIVKFALSCMAIGAGVALIGRWIVAYLMASR